LYVLQIADQSLSEIAELQAKLKATEQTLVDMRDMLETDIGNLTDSNAHLVIQINGMETQKSSLQAELNKANDMLATNQRQLSQQVKEIQQLKSQIAQLEVQLQHQKSESSNKIDSLQKKLQISIEDAKESALQSETTIDRQKSELLNQVNYISSLQQKFDDLQIESEGKSRQYEAKLNAQVQEFRQKVAELQELSVNAEKLKSQLSTTEAQLVAKSSEFSELQALHASTNQNQSQKISEQHDSIASLKLLVEKLQHEHESQEQQADVRLSKLSTQQSSKVVALNGLVSSLQQQVSELQSECEKRSGQLEQLRQLNTDLINQHTAQISLQTQQVDSIKSSMEQMSVELNAKVSAKESQIVALQSSLQTVSQDLVSAQMVCFFVLSLFD
jgi:chromosome segregation ATPase